MAEVKQAYKGLRQKLGHVTKEIGKAFQTEEQKKKKKKKKRRKQRKEKEKEWKAKAAQEGKSRAGKKRKRPWTVVEIFSWTCAISIMATLHGWTASEPISWDTPSNDRQDALRYLDQLFPDLLIIAWPCGVWSPLQVFGPKTPET